LIHGKKLWLNLGVLSKDELNQLKPYIWGVCGAVECVNVAVHDKVCPSKPISEIEEMFRVCEELGLKKSMTIIIGLGEKIEDFELLERFIRKNNIDKITFYALNPHEETCFKKGPESDYYADWIRKTRVKFPELDIVAGSWVDRLGEISKLLDAGANNITKFPSIKLFGTKFAHQIEKEMKRAGRDFQGTLTKLPDIEIDEELDEKIKQKISQYIETMKNAKDRSDTDKAA